MVNNTQIADFDEIRVIASGSISGSYAAIGAPFASPVRAFKVYNSGTTAMFISNDGVTDKEIVPGGGFILWDVTSDRFGDFPFGLRAGTQMYVRQVSGAATDSVYLTCLVGKTP